MNFFKKIGKRVLIFVLSACLFFVLSLILVFKVDLIKSNICNSGSDSRRESSSNTEESKPEVRNNGRENEIAIEEVHSRPIKNVKIIATYGPSIDSEEMIKKAVESGVNVFRINMSHSSVEDAKAIVEKIRKIKPEQAIMIDTKGPEIRTATANAKDVVLKKGGKIVITTDALKPKDKRVSVSYGDFVKDIKVGSVILIDDSAMELKVLEIKGNDVVCEVQNDGKISNKKSLNLPNDKVNMVYISEKDKADISFACETKANYIAASFVRRIEDLQDIDGVLDRTRCPDLKIIAKIENQEGIDNIDQIIGKADAIMVARGDMASEISFENVPKVQKMITEKCNAVGKDVVVATQMLESMKDSPRPTRAEASDVYNAVLDGADFTMLSGETANGKYPIEAVKAMRAIIDTAN